MSRNHQPHRPGALPIITIAILGVLTAQLFSRGCSPQDPEEEAVAEAPPPATFQLTEEGILALSPFIRSARLTPADGLPEAGKPSSYQASISIDKDPHSLGAGDWNVVAHDIHSISELLLNHPQTRRISFSFASPEQDHLEWARATVSRERLPQDWEALSYLQFFGRIEPEAATQEAATWLCEFYRQYASARPGGSLPGPCSRL